MKPYSLKLHIKKKKSAVKELKKHSKKKKKWFKKRALEKSMDGKKCFRKNIGKNNGAYKEGGDK